MSYLPDRIYRHDRERESVWEALDGMPEGMEFTLGGLFDGKHGPVSAGYSMVCAVVRDAVALGAVERLYRLPYQGGPWLLRKRRGPVVAGDRSGESMTPPAGWRSAKPGAS